MTETDAFLKWLPSLNYLHASDAPTPEPVDPGRQPGSEPEMTPPPAPEPESPAAEEPPATEEPTA